MPSARLCSEPCGPTRFGPIALLHPGHHAPLGDDGEQGQQDQDPEDRDDLDQDEPERLVAEAGEVRRRLCGGRRQGDASEQDAHDASDPAMPDGDGAVDAPVPPFPEAVPADAPARIGPGVGATAIDDHVPARDAEVGPDVRAGREASAARPPGRAGRRGPAAASRSRASVLTTTCEPRLGPDLGGSGAGQVHPRRLARAGEVRLAVLQPAVVEQPVPGGEHCLAGCRAPAPRRGAELRRALDGDRPVRDAGLRTKRSGPARGRRRRDGTPSATPISAGEHVQHPQVGQARYRGRAPARTAARGPPSRGTCRPSRRPVPPGRRRRPRR